jgi:hypothetical protein
LPTVVDVSFCRNMSNDFSYEICRSNNDLPIEAQNTIELPVEAQNTIELPIEAQNTIELPLEAQNTIELPVEAQNTIEPWAYRAGGRGGRQPPPVCWANKASRAIFAQQSGNIGLL